MNADNDLFELMKATARAELDNATRIADLTRELNAAQRNSARYLILRDDHNEDFHVCKRRLWSYEPIYGEKLDAVTDAILAKMLNEASAA